MKKRMIIYITDTAKNVLKETKEKSGVPMSVQLNILVDKYHGSEFK